MSLDDGRIATVVPDSPPEIETICSTSWSDPCILMVQQESLRIAVIRSPFLPIMVPTLLPFTNRRIVIIISSFSALIEFISLV